MTNDKNFSNEPLSNFLSGLVLGEPLHLNDLTIVPAFCEKAYSPIYLDLEAALRAATAIVEEVSASGTVPELAVVNGADRDLLILDGEELVGAKQNRTVNVTILVAAGSTITIPVACVERGRWRYQTDQFAAGDAHLYPSLRSERAASVAENLKQSRSRQANQGAVWSSIEAKSRRMGVRSDTEAMQDIYSQKLGDATGLEHVFAWQAKQCGLFAFIRGGFAGADLFGTPQFCAVKLPKLVRGFYLDSLDAALTFPKISAPEILEDVRTARHEPFESPGKGFEVRFENHQLHGAWMLDGNAVPHVAVFPRVRPVPRSRHEGVIH